MIVEDLARAGYPAAVQPQVSVVVCAGAAWCYRCSRRELRRLNFAEQGRSRNGIVDATWARWHRERCGRSVGRRRDDLRIARNVIRSRRGGYANDVITTAWTCWIAEVDIEFVVAVRECDLSLLCRIIEASRRQKRGAAGIQQVERCPDNRGARHRVVYHSVRLDRQIQILQIGAGLHDDIRDSLHSVRERRDSASQHRGVRARTRRAETQLVTNAS